MCKERICACMVLYAPIRSKKRIKGQNFCQTIEDLSFHKSGYLSNDRYMLFEMLQYEINCTI